jgi:hypothetical protein
MANSTFSNFTSNHSKKRADETIRQFSPKKETLSKIMAYSRALEMKRSHHLKDVEVLLN